MNFNKITKVADHHWDIHLVGYSNISHRCAFIHQSPYVSQNYNLSLHPSLTYGYKDLFEFTPEWKLNEQYGHYSTQTIADQQNFRQCIGLSTLLN